MFLHDIIFVEQFQISLDRFYALQMQDHPTFGDSSLSRLNCLSFVFGYEHNPNVLRKKINFKYTKILVYGKFLVIHFSYMKTTNYCPLMYFLCLWNCMNKV